MPTSLAEDEALLADPAALAAAAAALAAAGGEALPEADPEGLAAVSPAEALGLCLRYRAGKKRLIAAALRAWSASGSDAAAAVAVAVAAQAAPEAARN